MTIDRIIMDIIISHTNCDFDGFASMLAASLLYPEARICLTGSIETNLKHFLDRYHNKFDLLKEKNVNIEEVNKLITVDNRDLTRMGKFGPFLTENNSIRKKLTVICYDHHPDSQSDVVSDYAHIDATGACTTIMLDFIKNSGIQISPFYASIFALGIYEDTGNFINANVTAKDFAALSYLFSSGASLDLIKEFLPKEFTSSQLKMINQMLSRCETVSIKGVEVTFIEIETEGFQDDIAYLLQTVKASRNLKLIFCLCYRSDKVQIIGRNDYDFIFLDKLMQSLGGGGHKSAAFASLSRTKQNDLKKTILTEVEKQVLDYGTAGDIMTVPVDLVKPEITVNEAREFLLSKHYSTLLIGDKGIVSGILTKKDISRAIHHQMGDRPVDSCMSTNVMTVKESESIYTVYKTMVDFNIGRIPVVNENAQVRGIITRSDLLHFHFHSMFKQKEVPADFDNISALMQKNLSEDIMDILKRAGHIADSLGMKAYAVGGFVRDLIMQRYNYDLDIVVEGDGLHFAREFTRKFGKRYKLFEQFGTAYVILNDKRKIDVATARTEFYAGSGSLPEVEYSSIRNDLYRRDFTINSLAVCINPKQFGLLLDYFGGRRDIRLRILKVLNNMSFVEDPLRILRAIRFEQRFGFSIENKTLHLLTNSLKQKSLKNVSVERIRTELIVSCKKGAADDFFMRLEDLGILKEININLNFSVKKREICKRIYELSIWFTNSFPAEEIKIWICYHLALLEELSLRTKLKIAQQLKYPGIFPDSIRKTVDLYEHYLADFAESGSEGDLCLRLRILNNESIIYLLATAENPAVKEIIIRFLNQYRYITTELNGADLLAMGIPEGKIVGKLLAELWKTKINNLLPDRKAEVRFIKKLYKSVAL